MKFLWIKYMNGAERMSSIGNIVGLTTFDQYVDCSAEPCNFDYLRMIGRMLIHCYFDNSRIHHDYCNGNCLYQQIDVRNFSCQK